ncbi:hypothetical protein POM88_024203 [Heracleum sosnowskyi]|uniref:Uncharacterized protein n=1 Tax=Heracleum sosnowskyi TaxID=360622 RepID=A0AAD8I2U3_9APIA|nr:hypothetical protein POM88_024203 [Heracleum sosnowskyi]
MDYSVETKINIIREQASNAVKGKVRSPSGSRGQKFQDKQGGDVTSGQTCIERNYVSRRNTDDVPGVQKRHAGKQHKQGSRSDIKKDDGLVKHMSNLPGYLQKKERGEDVQGKVLSFGVLDWKSNEDFIPARRYSIGSSSESEYSCLAGGSSTASSAARQRRVYSQRTHVPSNVPSNVPRPNSSHEERLGVRSQGKVSSVQRFEAAPRSSVDWKRNLYAKDKVSEIYLDREKRNELHNRKKSGKELSPLDRRNNALPTSLHVTKCDQDDETNSMVTEEIDLPLQSCGHESIVLLLPKNSPSKCGPKSMQLPKPSTSVDKNIGEVQSNSGGFSPAEKLHYLELEAEMPHSSPLPRRAATDVKSNLEPCSRLDVKVQFDTSGMHQRPKGVPAIPLYSKGVELNNSRLDPLSETSQTLNQIISAKPATPCKHLSYSNNARMAISPILRDGPSVPQLDSSYAAVKSGQVGSGSCAGSDISSRDNISANNKARPRILTTTDIPRRLDQDLCEQPATMGRHASPSRQFTFSRMTKSLSFKDGTSFPPLSSPSAKVKSGPLTSEAFSDLHKFELHNVTAGRSTMLTPLTKTETPRRLDDHPAVKPVMVERHPSPSRFSFGRMTKSLNSKEGFSVPRFSSSCATKSKPVGCHSSDGVDKLDRDNLGVSSSARFSPSSTAVTPRRLDQFIAEQSGNGERHPSPIRRFSFSSRPKISRSLDFKEVFSSPRHSQTVGLKLSAGPDKFNQENVSSSNRARSSPLRRLLDPLLKPRVANSVEDVKPSKENLTSVGLKHLSASVLVQNQKHETPNVQALLQLTRKNGLPLFKLVVDNGSDILAAAVKQLPAPGDDASSLIYALYSVHEIKNKNGGWMSQGSRGKRSSFGCNVIGQMKVSNSSPPGYSGDNMKYQYISRESVLYSVEIEQGNKEAPEFKPTKEFAAITIKDPYQKDCYGKQGVNDNLCSQEGFTEPILENACDEMELEDSSNTTVILGGVHGLPGKVVPSPSLIWRYGGSCDCGGWDVGCKLQILTSQDQKRSSRLSSSRSTGLDLFFEGSHQEKRPSFRLSPFKTGVYSVEFNSSISLLQSFFISIAFLSSQKHEIFEGILESNNFTEPKIDAMKFPTAFQKDIPAKYVTKPPASPVGRV